MLSYWKFDHIGVAVPEAEGYLWWCQVPVKMNREQLVAEVESYAQRLLWVASQIGDKPLLVLTLECIWETNANLSERRLSQAIEAFNNTAWSLAAERKNIKVVDFGKFLQQYPVSERIDWKYYFISQMIINPRLKGAFGTWLAEQQRALVLQRKKCLVLDLDNTLWGGVLGEDGIEGVQLDGDYPGKAFHAWQEGLRELANDGVILALCSENNEADVEALFAAREMPLKLEDFVSKRINWQDKATNIRAIAEELNIGLDSMVFVDDNPTERELIKQQLPMVAVPEFPAQPYGLTELYAQLVREYFSVYALTDEDRKKTEQYRQNASRKQLEAQRKQYLTWKDTYEVYQTDETRMMCESNLKAFIYRYIKMAKPLDKRELAELVTECTDIYGGHLPMQLRMRMTKAYLLRAIKRN